MSQPSQIYASTLSRRERSWGRRRRRPALVALRVLLVGGLAFAMAVTVAAARLPL